jgi:hypothetical protein
MDTILSSFSSFTVSGRYPCPARPDLPNTDPMAGVEDCTIAPVAGMRDTNGDGLNDPVLIGAIPYRTLKAGGESSSTCYSKLNGTVVLCTDPNAYDPSEVNFKAASLNDALDPWGYQMTYAVSQAMTNTNTFNYAYGVISVKSEFGIDLVFPPNSAHFVIFSHGDNHKGAYSINGQQAYPCTAGTVDAENCDGDAEFVNSLRTMNAGANYFDDILRFSYFAVTEIWKYSGPNQEHLYNVNPGFVGVGTTAPSQRLDVNGSLKAIQMKSTNICDDPLDTSTCWEPLKLGGTGMVCPPGTVATGIANGNVTCSAPVSLPGSLAGQQCTNPGEFMKGVDSGGNIVCGPP